MDTISQKLLRCPHTVYILVGMKISQCIIPVSAACLCGVEFLHLAFTLLYVYFYPKCSLHGIFDDNK